MTEDRWTYRVVDDEVEFCGPDPDLDVLTVPLSVVIAAIDASGTHKVIPVWLWDDMREAYLAEQKDGREVAQPPAPVGGGLP